MSFYGLSAHLEQPDRKQRSEMPHQLTYLSTEPEDKVTRMGDVEGSITSDGVFIRETISKATTKTMINTVLIVT